MPRRGKWKLTDALLEDVEAKFSGNLAATISGHEPEAGARVLISACKDAGANDPRSLAEDVVARWSIGDVRQKKWLVALAKSALRITAKRDHQARRLAESVLTTIRISESIAKARGES